MCKIFYLLALLCAAQRSFCSLQEFPTSESDELDEALRRRVSLREYLNFLLRGLRRDEMEVEPVAPYRLPGQPLHSDDLPLYSRHRPQNHRFPNPDLKNYYRRYFPEYFQGAYLPSEGTDEEEWENGGSERLRPQNEISRKHSNFAVPPTDPRFFQPSPSIQGLGDGDPVGEDVIPGWKEASEGATKYQKTVQNIDPQQSVQKIRDRLQDLKSQRDADSHEHVDEHDVEDTIEHGDDDDQDGRYDDDNDDVTAKLIDLEANKENIILIALVAGCSTGVVAGVALLIYGFIKLQRNVKAAADVEYPAYGVTGPNKESTPTGDRRLAHSAQMYHYQLTKQQIIAMESNREGTGERRGSISEADSDDDNEEGDYTVYECPGLAPAGEMEVKNPLFQDDPTPATNADQTTDSTNREGSKQNGDPKDDDDDPLNLN